MDNSAAQILEKLNPYWHLMVHRPLSEGEIHAIETDVGLTMPTYLREYLQIIGLFQDAFGGEIQLFEHGNELVEERNLLLEIFEQDASSLFPIGNDGAGNVFALKADDISDDTIYFADHETLTVEKWKYGFVAWLNNQIDTILKNIDQRRPNSQKSWCVQFSFAEIPLEKVVSVLQQIGVARVIDSDWKFEAISPAGVRSEKAYLEFDGTMLEVKRLDYRGWDSPTLFFDMRESVEIPLETSKIRQLDALFREHMPQYKLVDYGPLWTQREP